MNIEELKIPEHKERLTKFIEKNEEERNTFRIKKEKTEKEKPGKYPLIYSGYSLSFYFMDEELFQVCEAIKFLSINRSVLLNFLSRLREKIRKLITIQNLSNFGWKLANQFEISTADIVEFLSTTTFKAWFKNTEPYTFAKNLRNTQGQPQHRDYHKYL